MIGELVSAAPRSPETTLAGRVQKLPPEQPWKLNEQSSDTFLLTKKGGDPESTVIFDNRILLLGPPFPLPGRRVFPPVPGLFSQQLTAGR